MMKAKYFILSCIAALTLSLLQSCGTVPITGRNQVLLVSDAEVLNSSALQYRDFISKATMSNSPKARDQVTRVGRKVAQATDAYLKANGMTDLAKQMAWEFNVVENPAINAFCMPGGKIVVYTGLLKLVSSDAELATVVSHEVSHAVARHSNERISQEYLRRLGGNVLGMAVSQKSALLQTVVGQAYGIGTQVLVTLPYNRTQEYEADKLGLTFMAMAGYDPRAAISFWKKMSSKGGVPKSEFFSTHPSDQNRIRAIEEFMPTALKYYRK